MKSDTLSHDTCFVTIVSVDGDTGDAAVGTNVLNCTHKGKTVYAMVTIGDTAMVCDPVNGCPVGDLIFNHCWTEITVEDKIAPTISLSITIELGLLTKMQLQELSR